MTVHEALIVGIRQLRRAKDHRDSAALDAELLLAHVLDVERAALYTHPERVLTARENAHLRVLLQRRARHEPVAYIIGEKEFYGLKFAVTPDVLIPRSETETLVGAAIPHLHPPLPSEEGGNALDFSSPFGEGGGLRWGMTIIDIGTGSGAIAVALTTRLPASVSIVATDVSRRALTIARANARRHGVADRIRFMKCDLLPDSPLAKRGPEGSHPKSRITPSNSLFPRGRVEGLPFSREGVVIVANLPYLPTTLWRKTTPEIKKYEPRLALDGGKDGLDVYRRLLDRIPHLHLPLPTEGGGKRNRFLPPAYRGENEGGSWTLIAEMLPTQMRQFAKDVKRRFPEARVQRVGTTVIQVSPALKRTS